MKRLKEFLLAFFARRPFFDEEKQVAREARTEAARANAIRIRRKAEEYEETITASTDRVAQMRTSFERASRRLAK